MSLIVIALFFVACVAVAAAAMRLIPPTIWRIGALLSALLVVYLLFVMPAGGPHNPLPWLMAFPLAVIAIAGAVREVSLMARLIRAGRHLNG